MKLKEARELYLKYKASLGEMCRALDETKRKEFCDLNITEGTLRTWKYEQLLKNLELLKHCKSISQIDCIFMDSLFYLETYSDFQKMITVSLELKNYNPLFIKDDDLLSFIFNTKMSSPNTKFFDEIDLFSYICSVNDLEYLQYINQIFIIIYRNNPQSIEKYIPQYEATLINYNIPLENSSLSRQ